MSIQKLTETLDARIMTLLPETYRESYEELRPVSMGSAGLRYEASGQVAWNEIWGSFCDLAMAGGPPHRGTLLQPTCAAEISARPGPYREVVSELCRGVNMVTGLSVKPSRSVGWVRVDCTSAAMAGWLARAIVMENVSARSHGLALELPAGPAFRLEKEIKNVITAMAKTSHYWLEHTSVDQHWAIGDLFREMEQALPLIQPPYFDDFLPLDALNTIACNVARSIAQTTSLPCLNAGCPGWLGVDCGDVQSAVWILRALVASNVLSHREGTVVFIPINPKRDPFGSEVTQVFITLFEHAVSRGISFAARES